MIRTVTDFWREALAKLHAERPQTDVELRYCRARLDRRDAAVARSCVFIGALYHFISLFTDQFVVSPVDLFAFRCVHLFFFCLHSAWLLGFKTKTLRPQNYLWPFQLAFIAAIGFVMHRTVARGDLDDLVLASNGLMMLSSILLMMCPFHDYRIGLTALIYWLVAVFVFLGSSFGPRWIAIDSFVLSATTVMQYLSIARARMLALQEYRTLSKVAPAQILRSIEGSGGDLERSFQPAIRPVACISTDWRNYQKFSRTQNPATVAATLNDYYELCERLLSEVAPEGNYYSDWIADELFVVFFGKPKSSTRPLVQQGIEFCRRLILAKPDFLTRHEMPKAIDLGVATGWAMVGMMGPSGHRKATALGEVPGLARRLQTAGKVLRTHCGEEDRIIIDEQSADWVANLLALSSYQLEADESLRDSEQRTIFFLEPGALRRAA